MTREQAIREIRDNFTLELANEIIKALEQDPCNDAISRTDTLTKFKKVYFDNDNVIRCAEFVIGGMPSVNAE